MSKALPVCNAFTGCNTVSCFAGRGKKTAFSDWKNFPAVTDTFLQLAATPTSPISEACMERLERLVILLYDRTSNNTSVNETRKKMSAQKGRAYDAILPTRAALLQHTKQSCLSSWSLLGPSAYTEPGPAFTRGLGMDFETGRMAVFLDDASRCDQVVQRATSLWVQAWV